MTAESNARSLDPSDSNQNRIELDGLERFFEDDHTELFDKGLSLKQAVYYYGDTRKSLKAKVLQGLIPAIRLPEAFGKKWRVFPDGVPPQLEQLIPKKLKSSSNFVGDEDLSLNEDDDDISAPPAEAAVQKPESPSEPALKVKKSKQRKPKLAKEEEAETYDFSPPEQQASRQAIIDFSVPGIDRPGQLILQAAGFWVEESPLASGASFFNETIFPHDLSTADDAPSLRQIEEKVEPTEEDITASALAHFLLRIEPREIDLPLLDTQIIPAELQLFTVDSRVGGQEFQAPQLGITLGQIERSREGHDAATSQIRLSVTGMALIITEEGLSFAEITTLMPAGKPALPGVPQSGFCIADQVSAGLQPEFSIAEQAVIAPPAEFSVAAEHAVIAPPAEFGIAEQAVIAPPTEFSVAEQAISLPETGGYESAGALGSEENSIMELVGEAVFGARTAKQLRKKAVAQGKSIVQAADVLLVSPVESSTSQPTMPVAPPFPEILLKLQNSDTVQSEQLMDLLPASSPTLLADQIARLEKQLDDANYKNGYLETRVTALEDQIKFLTRSHYHNRSFNVMLLVIPALVLAILFVLRFGSTGTL